MEIASQEPSPGRIGAPSPATAHKPDHPGFTTAAITIPIISTVGTSLITRKYPALRRF